MKKLLILLFGILFIFSSCLKNAEKENPAPSLPEGNQAISLLGEALYSSQPSEGDLEKYDSAKLEYQSNSGSADALIWYGRRTAYLGKYREAIKIYTEGINKFPEDARMYRHRGHRYISIREFDNAIQDFEHAVTLIQEKENEIEPDGRPNARNIPVSTLHGNIWYHLGLAYYLKNDMENALKAYQNDILTAQNDDNLASATHWLYMILRRLGREEEANKVLEPIHADMDIIENMAYHKLCLFYKREIPLDFLTDPEFSSIMNDAVAYGLGNWYFYNGSRDKAKEIFEKILSTKSWASFGFIAAEVDFARDFKQ